MVKHFSGRVVLITGAANGIGRGLTRALSQRGARVAALDRDVAGLQCLAEDLKASPITTAVADVTDVNGLRTAVEGIEATLGPVDLVIANAGIMRQTLATEFRPEVFATEIQVNLIGLANTFSTVVPGMIARRRGHLVAMCSIASYRGFPPFAGYCASKAGVRSLCDAFRVELKPFGVRVTTLCPGPIATRIADEVVIPEMPPRMNVEDAVDRMIHAVAAGKKLYTFPARDAYLVRMLRYLPLSLSDWLVRRRFDKWQRSLKRAGESDQSSS